MCRDLAQYGLTKKWNEDHKKRPNHYRHLRDLSINLFGSDATKKNDAKNKVKARVVEQKNALARDVTKFFN